MKETNVLSSEYIKFQEQIYALYDKWSETLSSQTIVKKEKMDGKEYPLLPQLELSFDENDYHSYIRELLTVVKENKPELNEDINRLEAKLDHDILNKWFKESVIVNTYYFAEFAKKNHLPEWLPLFTAEHATRPYLQKAATELSEGIPQGHKGSCPVCGEHARLAMINKSGKKEVTCPRCHYSWEEKKISCAHCGTDEQGQILILKLEEDDSAEIYACKTCNGYTKVIDTRKLIKASIPELLDLNTIHLDYIAQEKGYGVTEAKDAN